MTPTSAPDAARTGPTSDSITRSLAPRRRGCARRDGRRTPTDSYGLDSWRGEVARHATAGTRTGHRRGTESGHAGSGLGLERAHRSVAGGRARAAGRRSDRPGASTPRRRRGAVGPRGAGSIDAGALEGADAVVHLAGAGIGDKRWSAARRHEIVSSRVQGDDAPGPDHGGARTIPRPCSGERLGRGLLRRPRGRVADRGRATGRRGFLAEVCAGRGRTPPSPPPRPACGSSGFARASCSRPTAGALARQLPLFRLGVGGRLGSGRQWLSWISLSDEVGAILHALDEPDARGPGQRHGTGAGDQPCLHPRPGPGAAPPVGVRRARLRPAASRSEPTSPRRWCSPANASCRPS